MKMHRNFNFIALLTLAMSFNAFCMDEPEHTPIEKGLPQLPPEIWGKEVFSLANLFDIINTSNSLATAANHIRKLALTNKQFNNLVNTSQVCQQLMQKLSQRFNCSLLDAANALNLQRIKLQEKLFRLCANDNLKDVQELIAQGADVNFVCPFDPESPNLITPLLFATDQTTLVNNTNVVKCLLDNGADINFADQSGHTPLMYALGRMSCIELFKNRPKLDINKKDADGDTVLMIYLLRRSLYYDDNDKIVKLLLKMGVSPTEGNKKGLTPLQAAKPNISSDNDYSDIIQKAIRKKRSPAQAA